MNLRVVNYQDLQNYLLVDHQRLLLLLDAIALLYHAAIIDWQVSYIIHYKGFPFQFPLARILMSLFVGYHTNSIKNESIAFDWRKFWEYLKPYLLKFLGAIAVSLIISLKKLFFFL